MKPGLDHDCKGAPLDACPPEWAGVDCDIPCTSALCQTKMHCHGWGGCSGLSSSNAPLFPVHLQWSDWVIFTALRNFIMKHPRDVGVAPGIKPPDLGLAPAPAFRSTAGALTLFRFEQRYRGIPVFGTDSLVTMVASSNGAIALRGMIVDGRTDYLYADVQANASSADASIIAHAVNIFDVPANELQVDSLALVAIPRFASVGWAATVARGMSHLGTLVVSADPESAELLPLLSFRSDTATGLVDTTPVTVRSEDLDSDVTSAPIETLDVSMLRDGSPLLGSQSDALYQLATTRLVGFDASSVPDINVELTPLNGGSPDFTASPGESRFDTQLVYHLTSNFYAFTNTFMHGSWESAVPFFSNMTKESIFAPGTFEPRGLVVTRSPDSCPNGAPACAKIANINITEPSEPYRHPVDHVGDYYEDLGVLVFEAKNPTAQMIAHEFGHFVDLFAKPGFFADGLECTLNQLDQCEPSCKEDTTEEGPALAESWAQLAAIWYLRSLSEVGDDPEICGVLTAVDKGENRVPHNDTCRPTGKQFSLFLRDSDPDCPNPDVCDKPDSPGAYQDIEGNFHPTGLCSRSPGYRVGSLDQALWELLHGQECAVTPPYTCAELPGLEALTPEVAIGEALLYAVRVSTGTYQGFVDDVATYVACNFGPDVYAEVNGVLCHHNLRDCDLPPPLTCESCRNGIREADEACDLVDLGGESCISLGFDGGSLACSPACTFDTSGCSNDTETATASGSSTTDASATTGGVSDAGGCGCRSSPTPGSAAFWLLGLAWLRRRSKSLRPGGVVRSSLLLSVLAVGASACAGDSPATTLAETTSTEADTSASSTSALLRPDPLFFGVFHGQNVPVGYSNEELPKEVLYIGPWDIVTIADDGSLRVDHYACGVLKETREYQWIFNAETESLDVMPTEGSLIEGFAQNYTKVSLTLEPVCGVITIVYTRTDGADVPVAHYPGMVCAEVTDVDNCRFHILWCDEGEGPACPEPQR